MQIKHAKVKTLTIISPDVTHITTKTYHNDLKATKQEVAQKIRTDMKRLMVDTISCLDVLTNGTSDKLNIDISYHQGILTITKTWQVEGEVY